jgi:hypothetical protein
MDKLTSKETMHFLDSVWLLSRDKKNKNNEDRENKIGTKTYLVKVYKTK